MNETETKYKTKRSKSNDDSSIVFGDYIVYKEQIKTAEEESKILKPNSSDSVLIKQSSIKRTEEDQDNETNDSSNEIIETKPLPSLPVPLPTSASTEKDTWKKRVTKLGHYLNPLKKNSKKGLVRNSVIVEENTNPSITVEKYLSNQENVLDLSKRN